ncbi:histone-lysine N-methyltransferase SETMAR [Trichonephila clavipes]|nr:histone-lysine N-methyltransferase SETMAR [Trichonephila clavipes]
MTLLRAQVKANPCQAIEELSNALNQPWSTIQEHLQQIGRTNRAGVWVPHNLSEENRANQTTTCNLLLQRYNTEPFFDHLITADEKWVLYDNPKHKIQWLSPNKPPRRTAKAELKTKKILIKEKACDGALSRLLTNPLGESLRPEWYINPTFSRRKRNMPIRE